MENHSGVIRNFCFPISIFYISTLLDNGYVALAVYVLVIALVNKNFLLLNYISLSFFNVMGLSQIPVWGSLVPTFVCTSIILYRNFDKNIKDFYLIFFLLTAVIYLSVNFFTLSLHSSFIKTAIKSTLQLISILYLMIVLLLISDEVKQQNAKFFQKYFFYFVIFYILFGVVKYVVQNDSRLSGGVGAQTLAYLLVIVSIPLWNQKNYKTIILILAAVFLTGSRTFTFILLPFLGYKFLRESHRVELKILALISLSIMFVLAIFLLPSLGSRYDYTNTEYFLGSFLGRFHNYENAFFYIQEHLIFGNGMGSMLKVLEDWIFEFYMIYQERGDTTIMHNEYLRILMESGIIGISFFFIISLKILKTLKKDDKIVYFVFLIGCMTENLLTTFSTGIICLALNITFLSQMKTEKVALEVN